MSIRMKSILAAALIVIIITAAHFLSGYLFTRVHFRDTILQELPFARDIAHDLVAAEIKRLTHNASITAEHLARASSEAEMTEIMADRMNSFPDFLGLSVLDRNAKVLAERGKAVPRDCMCLAQDYFSGVLAGKHGISAPHRAGADPELYMHVFQPVGPDRILVATLSGWLFTELIDSFKLGTMGGVFIADGQGTIIASQRRELVRSQRNFIKEAETNPEVREAGAFFAKMISSDMGTGRYSLDGEERICAYRRLVDSTTGWRVFAVHLLQESSEAYLVSGLWTSSLLFLGVGLVLAVLFSGVVMRPFNKIWKQNLEMDKLNATLQAQSAKIIEEHERALLLLDQSPLCCDLWDQDFKLIDCSQRSPRFFGLKDKREYMEKFSLLSPEFQPDGQRSVDIIRARLQAVSEGESCVMEWMHRLPDGEPVPMEVTLVRLWSGGGPVYLGYKRDIREYKRMMGEIESRDHLQKILNTVSALLLQSPIAGFERELHRGMGMLTGALGVDRMAIWKNHVRDDGLYYSQVFEFRVGAAAPPDGVNVPPDAWRGVKESRRFAEKAPSWEAALSRGDCVNSHVRDMPMPERAHFGAQGLRTIFAAPVFIQDRFWGFVGYDCYGGERAFNETEQIVMRSGALMVVTALSRNEMTAGLRDASAKLEAAWQDASKANNAKSVFLAQMSHEMRTPLNAIIGLSELILEENGLGEAMELNLEKIYNAGSTLLSIVNDILDISKIEAGQFELLPAEYEVPSLLNDVIVQNILRIGDKPVRFLVDIDEGLPLRLRGDDLRIKQILSNLLSNAFKFTQKGQVEFGVRCAREGETAWLTAWVRDTGPGIRPGDLPYLFTDYRRMDTETHRKIEGTGLGLSITKKMAEMMDGSVSVESEYGKGAVFTVRLRQGFVSDAVIGRETTQNLKHVRYSVGKRRRVIRRTMPYARILVVDDNATNLDVARGIMRPYGVKIDCVQSGREAVEAIREAHVKYNAIFMDHMMPEMNGIEAVRIIREEIGTEYARNIPIIAFTANAIVGNEDMFLNRGFHAFISKPIDLARLDAVLRTWVRDKNLEDKMSSGVMVQPEELKMPLFPGRVDGADLQKGFERFGGDMEAFLQVLRSYVAHTPPLLDAIERTAPENSHDYAIMIHGIKGASRGICADRIGDMAEAMEKSAQAGNFALVSANIRGFLETVRKLVADLERLLSQVGLKPAKDMPDASTLSKLAEACGNFDIDGIDQAMSELESWRYAADGGLAAWLRDNVDRMNYAQIKERLSGGSGENGGAT